MKKNTGKVGEFCQSGKVGTLYVYLINVDSTALKIPDMSQFLWLSLSQICVYFLNKTISSQITSNNS